MRLHIKILLSGYLINAVVLFIVFLIHITFVSHVIPNWMHSWCKIGLLYPILGLAILLIIYVTYFGVKEIFKQPGR